MLFEKATIYNSNKNIFPVLLLFVFIAFMKQSANAEMFSADSSLGANTITYDSETGLKWLDITLSTSYSYDEILEEIKPGGIFAAYRLATDYELLAFWENAGINTSTTSWTAENYQPIVDFLVLLGKTDVGANLDYTGGHIQQYTPGGRLVLVATLSADHSTLTGRPFFGTVPTSNEDERHGTWLIAKPKVIIPSIPLLLLED